MNAQMTTMKGNHSAIVSRTFALSLVMVAGLQTRAMAPPLTGSGMGQVNVAATLKAAGCSPATQATELKFNNVRAVIENGGNKWQVRGGTTRSGYEVPITLTNDGPRAIYSGGLWMGGLGEDGSLKIAAVLYRQGGQNDFWPGPLTTTGDASVDADVCNAYDKFWTTSRAEAEAHVQWKNCGGDPDCLAEAFPNGYSIPTSFTTWPAEGIVEAGQSAYLAPFFDYDGDGAYIPEEGDYPDYGFEITVEECKTKDSNDPVPLFGDQNIYWIFNDKGEAHTETNGFPIGLEVRAQAFAFSSNDEINNMTFYNYTVINQGSQTLTNTYFGHFVDPDLGNADDDFTGCDVERGMGYAYNWDDNDESTDAGVGYGNQPPAIGVDFFEGPYQDADTLDNPGPEAGLSCQDYANQDIAGIPYAGLGIGYGDGILDNERFGMRAFIYFNRSSTNANLTDPDNAIQFYNYLRSIWKNNRDQSYGGTGYTEASTYTRAFYMFPDESDPLGWGTNCVPQAPWREETPTLAQPDRRFVQSAGPFKLLPGAYNNVTVGVVWARAPSGGARESLRPLRVADDKAQNLFDNCFKILDGPDAPDLEVTELDQELILFIKNPEGSNNFGETYEEVDPVIPSEGPNGEVYDRRYRFQGYKVYQLRDAEVSVADLNDINLARLIYQGDVQDGVGQIVNYPRNEVIDQPVPTEMVNGADEGVRHSLRVTEDKFALGNPKLVNFKTYYFLAVAYGYNNYEPYNIGQRTGQPFPYVAGRKAAFGSIRSKSAIPHKPAPQSGGTVLNSYFNQRLAVTRYEGQGNGRLPLEVTKETEDAIVAGYPWRKDMLKYKSGKAPIDVKVVDPLKVPAANFEVWFQDSITPGDLTDAYWKLVNTTENVSINSDRSIAVNYEQLFTDYGISVTLGQYAYKSDQAGTLNAFTDVVAGSSLTFDDPNKAWFFGIPDVDGNEQPLNWIRSGSLPPFEEEGAPPSLYNDRVGKDDDQVYEQILGGTWAPWPLIGQAPFQPGSPVDVNQSMSDALISEIPSVQIVFTKDRNKWTRSPVLEQEASTVLSEGAAPRLSLRRAASIDKEGRKTGTPGCNEAEATLVNAAGMGWFPGFAIDLETGERLNIAYGENSFWGGGIGRDMKWNPSSQLFTDSGEPVFGGSHWIYVFKNQRRVQNSANWVPMYDQAEHIMARLTSGSGSQRAAIFESIAWVGGVVTIEGREFLGTDARVVLNVAKPYLPYTNYTGVIDSIRPERNGGLPLYGFSTAGFETLNEVQEVAEEFLDNIGIVPNPYYAFSGYETSRLDNRVKFINLPQTCTVSIYNTGGTLVRKFRKDNALTYLDWDLKNANNIPIAGGVYICHVDVPGVGEKVIKWFGALRPLDLQNF